MDILKSCYYMARWNMIIRFHLKILLPLLMLLSLQEYIKMELYSLYGILPDFYLPPVYYGALCHLFSPFRRGFRLSALLDRAVPPLRCTESGSTVRVDGAREIAG